eukprot:6190655-Pleurochrysis_carterae.AAC.3
MLTAGQRRNWNCWALPLVARGCPELGYYSNMDSTYDELMFMKQQVYVLVEAPILRRRLLRAPASIRNYGRSARIGREPPAHN